MTYFALFTLILADFCPKIAKFPPLCARMYKYNYTRRSGHYAPILLAPAEGWRPFGPLGALQALLGAFGPQ